MAEVEQELAFFRALKTDLENRGVPADRAREWAKSQIAHARQREHKGRPFAILALCGAEAAEQIAKLDASGAAPRAWF